MDKIKNLLSLVDTLLSNGYDNSNIVSLYEDYPYTTMAEFFGVSGGSSDNTVRRGVYVYPKEGDEHIFELVCNEYHGYDTTTFEVADKQTLVHFAF